MQGGASSKLFSCYDIGAIVKLISLSRVLDILRFKLITCKSLLCIQKTFLHGPLSSGLVIHLNLKFSQSLTNTPSLTHDAFPSNHYPNAGNQLAA